MVHIQQSSPLAHLLNLKILHLVPQNYQVCITENQPLTQLEYMSINPVMKFTYIEVLGKQCPEILILNHQCIHMLHTYKSHTSVLNAHLAYNDHIRAHATFQTSHQLIIDPSWAIINIVGQSPS